MGEPDLGLSHVALLVRDGARSAAFYARYARMQVVHRRRGRSGREVLWLSDRSRPFAIVLIESETVEGRLEGIAHLGVGCASRDEVDRLCALAREEECLAIEPDDAGEPVGYRAVLRDPDGHNLELSFGQEVGAAVSAASSPSGEAQSPGSFTESIPFTT